MFDHRLCDLTTHENDPSAITLLLCVFFYLRYDEESVRRRLSDYARPILQIPVTCIHAPLGRNVNFRIDSHVMRMLHVFLGKPSEDPYRHIYELRQVCEINHIHNVSADVIKKKLFPATLRDRAKYWFLKLGKEFITWTEMEEEFLRKYYSQGKMTVRFRASLKHKNVSQTKYIKPNSQR